jgi:uncharacterized protein
MDESGSRILRANRHAVWAAVIDPEVLRACIPGCTAMTGNPQDGYDAVLTQKIGPLRATFRVTITLTDVIPARSYVIHAEGSGGAAGFARGGARVQMTDTPEGGTLLSYAIEGSVGGKLARIGARLVRGLAIRLAESFFERFGQAIEAADTATKTGPSPGTLQPNPPET